MEGKLSYKPTPKKAFDREWDWKGYREDRVISVRIPVKLFKLLQETTKEQKAGSVSDVIRTILIQGIEGEKQRE